MSIHPGYILLTQGLSSLGVNLSTSAIQQLLDYVDLLAKWNKLYNLTAVRDPQLMITSHLLDSLSILPELQTIKRAIDVGCGAGLPGIPLAIARPDIEFTLLDSQQKKINFVQHVITSLALPNVTAVRGRVELVQNDVEFDMVVSRAFASLKDYVSLVSGICNNKTMILAMKGRREQVLSEQAELPVEFKIVDIKQLVVPGLNAERCVVVLTKQED